MWGWDSQGALFCKGHGIPCSKSPAPYSGVFGCALAVNSAVTGTLHTSLYSQTTTLDFPELESAAIPLPACPA